VHTYIDKGMRFETQWMNTAYKGNVNLHDPLDLGMENDIIQ